MARDEDPAPARHAPRRARIAAGLTAAGLVALTCGAALPDAVGDPGTAAATPGDALVGHAFRSVAVERDGRPDPLFDGARVWLQVDRGSFGVTAGCNDISGGLRVSPTNLLVDEVGQTLVGCRPATRERRDDALGTFFGGDPRWRLQDGRLVLQHDRTTMTLEQDDLPPPLPRANPARRADLVRAEIGRGVLETWPANLGGSWGGDFVRFDVAARGRRTVLTMRARCRTLEATVRVHRATLTVGTPRTVRSRCRSIGADDLLDTVRPFFGGEVMWHLEHHRLTLQAGRTTLRLRVR